MGPFHDREMDVALALFALPVSLLNRTQAQMHENESSLLPMREPIVQYTPLLLGWYEEHPTPSAPRNFRT